MSGYLWTAGDAAAATSGNARGGWQGVTGISIDTRGIAPGELFVALAGENRDGHEFVVQLPDAAALDIEVTDDRGRPLALAAVTIQRQSELFEVDRPRTEHTDISGRLAFTGLVPGRYHVVVRHDERVAESESELVAGETTTLHLRLSR